ncbi:MAG: class I SAM-dependent methyltransferase family protein [Candidatus Bathyarchaeia archaeon]|nr:class I SAM-dependent methyltransferase family protein [Candidatus Bathyarchaeia archaeon]
MPKKSICIKAPKTYGEKAIILANKLKIVDRELEIQRNKDSIYIPLIRRPSENELGAFKEQVPDCEFSTYFFPERKKRVTTFVELLEDKLPPHLLASLPRAIDFVGDIAIIEIPPELDAHKNIIGESVLKAHKNVRTVLAKAGAVSGTYRLRELSIIAGEPQTETIHKEYGCQYHVDLAKAYFSPRLSYEHSRVASLVGEDETVVDLFAGVGPFSILIAKTHENVKVYAIDMNPRAVELLEKNIRLNRVEGKVYPILGDAKHIVKQRLSGVADRVIMNLPEKAIEFVDAACEAIKPTGGIVHYYSFVKSSDSLENVTQRFINAVKESGRKVEKILFSRLVRATAPYEWQAVLDAKIR